MTEALNKRTRRTIWRDILICIGGTPGFNDTIYQLVKKVSEQLGSSYGLSRPNLHTLADDILALNPWVYSTDERLNGHLLPPPTALLWGIEPDPNCGGQASPPQPGDGGVILGSPAEGFGLGNPETDEVFGHE